MAVAMGVIATAVPPHCCDPLPCHPPNPTGICSHVLDGAPLTVKKTLKADKRVRAGTDDPSGKKRRASEGEWQ